MGISWRDGDAVRAWEMRLPGMEEFGEYPGMGKRGGGWKKSRKNRAAGRTHVQGVLRRLRLGAAVEADEAHGLRRKERGHHQSGWRGAKGGTPPPFRPVSGDQRCRGRVGAWRGMLAPFRAAPTCLEVSLMRDPSYPCKKRIKKEGWCWWRSPRFSCPLERGNMPHPSAGSPTARGHRMGTGRGGEQWELAAAGFL